MYIENIIESFYKSVKIEKTNLFWQIYKYYKIGDIKRDTMIEIAKNYANYYNNIAKQTAKKYNTKAKLINYLSLLR